MYGKFRSTRSIYEGIIGRKKWDAADWLRRFLVRNEWVLLSPTHDGIGLEIELHSERGEQLIHKLHREMFPGFSLYVHARVERVWVAWFGYSEPIEISPSFHAARHPLRIGAMR